MTGGGILPTITEEQTTTIADWQNERGVSAWRLIGVEHEPPAPAGKRTGALQTFTLYVRAVLPEPGPVYAVNGIGEMVPDPREAAE